MRPSDPDYVAELKREFQLNMQPCRCSHCDPVGSERIFNYLRYLKESDFNQAVLHGIPEDIDVPPALSLNREATRKGRGKQASASGISPDFAHLKTQSDSSLAYKIWHCACARALIDCLRRHSSFIRIWKQRTCSMMTRHGWFARTTKVYSLTYT